MKKQLLLLITLLLSISSFSQCNYSFVLKDSFGDGWGGSTMSVKQNGVTVATFGSTFTSGSQMIISVALQAEVPFELFWNTSGSFPAEVGIDIVNPFGQTIYQKAFGTGLANTLLYYGSANCDAIPCEIPNALSVSNIGLTYATIFWSNSGFSPQWELIVLPAASPAPASSQSGVSTTTNSFMATGLTCFTNYKVYVRKVCGPSNISDWSVPFSFQTLGCSAAPTSVCTGASQLCDVLGNIFPNTVGIASQGTMGCLSTTPNSSWLSFSVNTPGTINMQLVQNSNFNASSAPSGTALNVNYILYGPYTSPITSCSTELTPSKILACNSAVGATKNISLTATSAGNYYYLMVSNASNNPGFFKISSTGGSGVLNCNGFRLNAFLDSNTNGVKDLGEIDFNTQGRFVYQKNNDSNIHYIYATNGILNILDPNSANTYDFNFQLNQQFTTNLSSLASFNDLPVGNGITNINFPILATGSYSNVGVSIFSSTRPRPSSLYYLKLQYYNCGYQTIANGSLTFTKDPRLSISAISQSGTVSTPTGFNYAFTNLQPFETRIIDVMMLIPGVSTIQVEDLITNTVSVSILPLIDSVPANNSSSVTEAVVNSNDPNDITEAHGEKIVHSTFTSSDYLYYTVRFENIGNAPAINVRVNNVLDAKLDENSIEMIGSSNNSIMDRVGNIINWDFKNIMLPASGGKGYLVYKIKPKPGYLEGDIIPSSASIYFDFNQAIVTNTFNTEFVSQLGVEEFENASFLFYPNPTKDILTVLLKNKQDVISNIAVYTLFGKVIFDKRFSSTTLESINLSNVSKGIYLIEVTTQSNLKVIKKLIVE